MKFVKFTLIILAIAIVSIAVLQIDDELQPSAKALISELEKNYDSTNEAYLYLNGIQAAENDSVIDVGRERTKSYKAAEKYLAPSDPNITYQDYNNAKQLDTPYDDNPVYCKLWKERCLESILKGKNKWSVELDFREVILRRYLVFLEYKEFTTITKPTLYQKFPKYQYIGYGNRLRILRELQFAENGKAIDAIKSLLKDIAKLRIQLVTADSTLHKIMFTMMIANNLDIIAYISVKYGVIIDSNIAPLTEQERDWARPLQREFGFAYYVFMHGDRNPELFEIGGNTPSWLVRLLFKPHMTINRVFELNRKVLRFSELSLVEMAKTKLKTNDEYDLNLRNYVGSAFIRMTEDGQQIFYDLVTRLNDLNLKIALTNYVINGKKNDLINPYYGQPEVISVENKKLCLSGPSVDKRNLRCIQVEF